MGDTKIQWTDRTWNPVRGCSRVSEGCRNCYAERIAARFSRGDTGGMTDSGYEPNCDALPFSRVATPRGWTGRVELVESKLLAPLRWRKPSRVFANSMSDLFHQALTHEERAAIFGIMAAAPQHQFQVLTKRPEVARDFFAWMADATVGSALTPQRKMVLALRDKLLGRAPAENRVDDAAWPLPNVWLGVSVEDQHTADERIPLLLDTPAAVRFVSYEPALGPVDFSGCAGGSDWLGDQHDDAPGESGIDRIIVGGESGPGARPFDVEWARSTIAQCKAAGVACFVKQLGAVVLESNDAGFDGGPGEWPSDTCVDHEYEGLIQSHQGAPVRLHLRDRKGGDPSEWPEDLRVREFPR